MRPCKEHKGIKTLIKEFIEAKENGHKIICFHGPYNHYRVSFCLDIDKGAVVNELMEYVETNYGDVNFFCNSFEYESNREDGTITHICLEFEMRPKNVPQH